MSRPQVSKRLVGQLVLAAVAMFGFGFLLSPLYDVFCQVTGLNGKVTRTGAVSELIQPDPLREVRVQLIAVNNAGMPWQFEPEQPLLIVHPGESAQTHYRAYNPTAQLMQARAVPSVAPAEAARYLQKINCFCFEAQTLAARASQQMPLMLMVDPELPAHISTITLSYTLFDITPAEFEPDAGARLARRDGS